MKRIYRIVKHTYYEKGEKLRDHYTIQYQSKFLWWKLWDSIMDIECHGGDCQTYPLTFDTEIEAINMINNLQNGCRINGWDKEVIKVLEFPKDIDYRQGMWN